MGHTGDVTHPVWPLFDLRVRTPRLELRYVDDELACSLALLAAQGVHDPASMPFGVAWTDVEPPQQQLNTMQFYWRCRAELSPSDWNINFAVIVGGEVVGTTALIAHDFPILCQFETGSWLGRAHQGRGLGKEMRVASLQLGFAGLDALWATTGAWADNGPSLGVTNALGYEPQGSRRSVRRGAGATMLGYEMSRERWQASVRRDDIALDGVEPCLSLLGADRT
jgi:RimJ/RimL family protein N-acetyltransferase